MNKKDINMHYYSEADGFMYLAKEGDKLSETSIHICSMADKKWETLKPNDKGWSKAFSMILKGRTESLEDLKKLGIPPIKSR